MIKIFINKNGSNIKNNKEIYIGRPSIFSNPFPTKVSKFSSLKFSHQESMKMYFKYVDKNLKTNKEFKNDFLNLLTKKEIYLNCFCIVKEFKKEDFENFQLHKVKCHAEIISYFLYKLHNGEYNN